MRIKSTLGDWVDDDLVLEDRALIFDTIVSTAETGEGDDDKKPRYLVMVECASLDAQLELLEIMRQIKVEAWPHE